MRDTVLGALCAAILMLGLPAVVMAGDPSTPSATRHRLERPETGDGRRGLISVPRWALLSAGASVVVLGLAGLVRMRREDSTP